MKALVFDTETTGLVENRTVKLEKQPHIIEFFGQIVDLKTGKVHDQLGMLIKPPIPLPKNVKGNKGIAEMTGITEAMLADKKAFGAHAYEIKNFIQQADMVIAHNLRFDMDMVEIEFERIPEAIKWPAKKCCTVEATLHLRGHRQSLTKLYQMLFPGETFVPHRAENDVPALARCCVELYQRELIS